jgi:hypothetical protein
MEFMTFVLLTLLVAIRFIETYRFVKKVNKLCGRYDWKFVETNEGKLLEMLSNKDYFVNSEWSAYNFLFLKGPNPLTLFFTLKPITLEAQYNAEAIEKLKTYEII